MQFIRGYQGNQFASQPIAATIGNFDGIHLGHQVLIQTLKEAAKVRQLPTAVILFEPQPAEYLHGTNAAARLYPLREKLHYLKQLGIDYVICLKFDHKLAQTSAEAFVEQVLFNRLNVQYMLCGEDFRFGYQRKGNYAMLKAQAQGYDIDVECFHDFVFEQLRVSSTQIRDALKAANFDLARQLLGRAYAIGGRVMHGAKRGRQWGIPTANIKIRQLHPPLKGVYDVWVRRDDNRKFPAVANIGTRPTVDGCQSFLEVHLHQFKENLYGERLNVIFLHKRRDEIKFSGVDALIDQIRQDILASKAYFATQYDLDLKSD